MELKAGYKITEMGVIPNDWEIKQLAGCLIRKPDYGINAAAVTYNESLPTYLRITDITENGYYSSASKVSVEHVFAHKFYLEEGDIVFARTGASVGKTYLYTKTDGKLVFAGFLIRVKTNPEFLDYRFLIFLTQTKFYWSWVTANSMRSGQPGLNSMEFSSFKIPVPSLYEQTAIATALSDADALISSLEKLIAKKRNIKQGAMQKLLQPKEGWEVKRLGEIATIVRGASPRPIEDPKWFNESSSIGWVRISDVTKSIKVLTDTTQKLSELGIQSSRYVEKENLIMSICATVGRPILTKIDVCIHDGFVVFRNPKVDKEYLYYFLSFIEKDWSKNGQTGSQMNLNTTIINTTEIPFPPTNEEQIFIANILSDMDVEIGALETKLEKYRNIKLGMMQNLLTGKIRLV